MVLEYCKIGFTDGDIAYMFRDLYQGADALFRGISAFYNDRSLWRYALWPMLIMVFFYVALLIGGWYLAGYLVDCCSNWARGGVLAGVVGSLVYAAVAVLIISLAVVTVSCVYEILGGLFFDSLIEQVLQRKFGGDIPRKDWRFSMGFLAESLLYGVNTLILTAGVFILSLFLPVIGQLLLIGVVCYRMTVGYVGAVGFVEGHSLMTSRCWARKNFYRVMGYGTAVYILLLVPMMILFILPGMVIGAVEIMHSQRQ